MMMRCSTCRKERAAMHHLCNPFIHSLFPSSFLFSPSLPQSLDPALLRPGRLSYVIHVLPPKDAQERKAILRVHTRKVREEGRREEGGREGGT